VWLSLWTQPDHVWKWLWEGWWYDLFPEDRVSFIKIVMHVPVLKLPMWIGRLALQTRLDIRIQSSSTAFWRIASWLSSGRSLVKFRPITPSFRLFWARSIHLMLCVLTVGWQCATDSFWFRSPQRLTRICSTIPLTCDSLQHILPMDHQNLCSSLHFTRVSQISWGPMI
jgi:hypothetical protein